MPVKIKIAKLFSFYSLKRWNLCYNTKNQTKSLLQCWHKSEKQLTKMSTWLFMNNYAGFFRDRYSCLNKLNNKKKSPKRVYLSPWLDFLRKLLSALLNTIINCVTAANKALITFAFYVVKYFAQAARVLMHHKLTMIQLYAYRNRI